ncbi:MAG TPA: hypothetical protein VGQ57_20960 [Polyangiaceae bacterium]|nr:hypothetical protein [Polyangiaceae bacterium]
MFTLVFVPSLAWADESPAEARARLQVQAAVVKPLAGGESHRFSRERPPPRERRVRIQASAKGSDKNGREFLPFAMDSRFAGGDWALNDVVGCVYPKSGEVFVKIGDGYRPAAFLQGKNLKPVPSVCEAAPPPARA